jgi:hypothetical protein
MSPILGIWASSFNAGGFTPTGSYDALATYTVPSGGVSSITFAGLPTGGQYSHLQIRMLAKSAQAGTGSNGVVAVIELNGNTITKNHYLYGDGANINSGVSGDTGFLLNTVRAGNTSVFSAGVVDILDFASTSKNKTIRWLGGYDANGSGELSFSSNLWASTEAINSIKIRTSTDNFAEYSQFALYGVKG